MLIARVIKDKKKGICLFFEDDRGSTTFTSTKIQLENLDLVQLGAEITGTLHATLAFGAYEDQE